MKSRAERTVSPSLPVRRQHTSRADQRELSLVVADASCHKDVHYTMILFRHSQHQAQAHSIYGVKTLKKTLNKSNSPHLSYFGWESMIVMDTSYYSDPLSAYLPRAAPASIFQLARGITQTLSSLLLLNVYVNEWI